MILKLRILTGRPESVVKMDFPAKTIALLSIPLLAGCGTLPAPAWTHSGSSVSEIKDIHIVARSRPDFSEMVLKCIAENLEKNAGLKIVGVISEEDESPYVFAAPEKSGELLAIRIKELNATDQAAGIRLTLVLRVFNGSGDNIYTRSITGVSGAGPPQNNNFEIEKALLSVAKDVLRQYAKDPTLRPLIMKYKLSSLLRFI